MTHNLVTPETLGNQPDKVLFRVDPSHSAFPEFVKWAESRHYHLSVGKDKMTLPKDSAIEAVSILNQKGWTKETPEHISERIVAASNSRVMSIAARQAAAAKSASHQSTQAGVKTEAKAEKAEKKTVH